MHNITLLPSQAMNAILLNRMVVQMNPFLATWRAKEVFAARISEDSRESQKSNLQLMLALTLTPSAQTRTRNRHPKNGGMYDASTNKTFSLRYNCPLS